MSILRDYINADDVSIGDVVRSFDDAFGTSIVESIRLDDTKSKVVWLVRPHLAVYGCGGAAIKTERYSVCLDSFVKNFAVYVRGTGGAKDNRYYEIK